ncbi:MAG: MutS-related protein [Streptosporangiaceae bacterium]
MTSSSQAGSGSPFSADGASASVTWRLEASEVRFQSILFEQPTRGAGVDGLQEPDFFADLNLDQVLESMTVGRRQYELKPFFYAPLHDATAVRYRHEVLRDLEKPLVLESVTRFAETMRRMREHLAQAEKLHYPLQKQARFLDAVEIYCAAVCSLAEELGGLDVTSRGFQGLRDHLAGYAASGRFTSLAAETQALKEALAGVRYAIRIHGARVTVSNYEGEPDYSAEVEETFAKFKQGAVKSYLVELPDFADMNHVEAQILDRVARLNPDVFGPLAEYRGRHRDHLDATVGRFDREVQFYLAYIELIGRFKAIGLPFCYPHVSAHSKDIGAEETFDLALANKLVPEGGTVVGNDFYLEEPERIFVVTGPNNGGKTTFARMFGQLHFLASLGLPVPGKSARLFLPDRIYTHFEREEDIETLRGKFEDELVRVHEILGQATSESVLVMNESFNSTTLNDALFVGAEVMRRVLELGPLGVYVTFVDEIASLSEATVSMVSQVVPENPAQRTFKLVRQPADGLAYAAAIADKYGLSYERLIERIGS